MRFARIIILGCAIGASFFIGCNQAPEKETSGTKEMDMYEPSEMALLMRKMYEDNLVIRQQIIDGEIPSEFPEDFYNIHEAALTKGMVDDTATFDQMAKQYIKLMEATVNADNIEEARIHYNDMVITCASCHQLYCQGPLSKIKKMKIKADGAPAGDKQG